MHPNSFISRHVISVANKFSTSSAFSSNQDVMEYRRYKTYRHHFSSAIHNIVLYILCIQILAVGLQPWITSFWQNDENYFGIIKYVGYAGLQKMIPIEVGSFNVECMLALIIVVLDEVLDLICMFSYFKFRLIPYPLLVVSKVIELCAAIFFMPGIMAAYGHLIRESTSMATTVIYILLAMLSIYKSNSFLIINQGSISFAVHIFYATTAAAPRLYITLISTIAFFANLAGSSFIRREILCIAAIVIELFLFMFEVFSLNWKRRSDKTLVMSTLTTSLISSVVVEMGIHISNITPKSVLMTFLISLAVTYIFFYFQLINEVNKTLKRLSMPSYPKTVISGRQAAADLIIGFREVAPVVVNMSYIEQIHKRFEDSVELSLTLGTMSLVLDDFPFKLPDLQNSLVMNNVLINYGNPFSISTASWQIDEELYKKQTNILQKHMWKALAAMSEFYKSIMNEMVDVVPINSFQCHDLIDKAGEHLLHYLEMYPGRDDGKFFFDLFRRIAPDHPSIKEMEYWCNYKINFVEEITEMFPKLTTLLLNNQDTLTSYVPQQTQAIGKSVVEVLQMEEVFTGKQPIKIATSGPFMSTLLHPVSVIVFILILAFFIIESPIFFSPTPKADTVSQLSRIYTYAETTNKIITHIYPIELFIRNKNLGDLNFWNDELDAETYRQSFLKLISNAQDQLMMFSSKDSTGLNQEIDNTMSKAIKTIQYYDLLHGNFSYYHAGFGFLYLATEMCMNESILINESNSTGSESISFVENLTAVTSPLYTSLLAGIRELDLFENGVRYIYIIVGIGLGFVVVIIPVIMFASFKIANKKNNAFFASLRDTQKTALSTINNFLYSQMRNIWGKKAIWHSSTETGRFPFWALIAPIFILIALFIIQAISLVVHTSSYRNKILDAERTHERLTKQYLALCQIVKRSFAYLVSSDEESDLNFQTDILKLQSHFIFMAEKKAQESVFAVTIPGWLDNAKIQDWLSSSSVLINSNTDKSSYIRLLREFFTDVDDACNNLIKETSDSWRNELNKSSSIIITVFVLFTIVPVCLIAYLFIVMKSLDSPFLNTISMLELISEKALSYDTNRVLNNTEVFTEEDNNLNQSFYDIILKTLPDAVFVIGIDLSIISYNKSADQLIKGKRSQVGKLLPDVLSIQFTIKDAGIPLNEVLSSYTQDDCISIQTYDITGKSRDRERYFAMTILPLFMNKDNGYLGRSHGASTFAVIFRECTSETLQQDLIEKETKKYLQIINQILPKEIADRLLKEQKSISMTVNNVCISFCDIVSFTPWCAGQTAESVVSTLNTMFTLFDDRCMRYRSVNKIKTIGDCYMSAAGIFQKGDTQEEAAHQMLLFGLDMVDAIKEVNKRLNTSLRVRVGIAFGGPISAGLMGIRKPAFDVYGQVVNDGQTMESSGTPMMVHINKEMYEIVKDANVQFQVKEDGTVLVTRKV